MCRVTALSATAPACVGASYHLASTRVHLAGKLEEEEMKAALRLMGVATNEKEANDLFKQMDADNSGFIVLNEFVEVWAFLKSKQAGSANSASAQYYAPGDSYHPPGDMSMTMFFQPEPPMDLTPWLDTTYYKEALDGFNIYDPTLWLPTIRFSVKGMMFWPWFSISVLTFLQCLYLLELNPESASAIVFPLDAHVILGGALAFLVVMRTDASMNHWWEARCSWQQIMNSCVSIGCQTAPALPTVQATEQMLMELMAFCVCFKAFLRDTTVQPEECGGRMDWEYIRALNAAHNPPITALQHLTKTARENLSKQLGAAIYDETSESIREINDAVGACMKIKRTSMVFSYVATLRSFLILWLSTMSIPLIGEFGWLAVPASSLIAFLFLNIEQMAVEIEQPFGNDANDLPIEAFLIDLEKILLEMTPGWKPDLGDGGGKDGRQGGSASVSDALARRIAALESAWQADYHTQAQKINELTTELAKARQGTAGGAPVAAGQTDWNKMTPLFQQTQPVRA